MFYVILVFQNMTNNLVEKNLLVPSGLPFQIRVDHAVAYWTNTKFIKNNNFSGEKIEKKDRGYFFFFLCAATFLYTLCFRARDYLSKSNLLRFGNRVYSENTILRTFAQYVHVVLYLHDINKWKKKPLRTRLGISSFYPRIPGVVKRSIAVFRRQWRLSRLFCVAAGALVNHYPIGSPYQCIF